MTLFLLSLLSLLSFTCAQVDFCSGKLDGSYCFGNFIYTCQFGRTATVKSCSACVQNSVFDAACSSYIVPPNYCTVRYSGLYCYRPFGSSIETSIKCDLNKNIQQQTCLSGCDISTGQCISTINTGTPAQCSSDCRYGCTFSGACKLPPFCTTTKSIDRNYSPFCQPFVSSNTIDSQLNTYSQDSDARTLFNTLYLWPNVSYPDSCTNTLARFACENKFLNCNEKGTKYQTCQTLCQDTLNCMTTNVDDNMTNTIPQIDCRKECGSFGTLLKVSYILMFLTLIILFL